MNGGEARFGRIPVEKGCVLYLTEQEYRAAVKRGKMIERRRRWQLRMEDLLAKPRGGLEDEIAAGALLCEPIEAPEGSTEARPQAGTLVPPESRDGAVKEGSHGEGVCWEGAGQ